MDEQTPTHLSPAVVIEAQAELSRLALSDGSVCKLLSGTCEILSRVLRRSSVGVFEQFGDSIGLRAGIGISTRRPLPIPCRVLDPSPIAEVVDFCSDKVLLAGLVKPGGRAAALVVGPLTNEMPSAAERGLVGLAASLVAGGWAQRHLDNELRSSERRLVEAQELAHMGSYDWNIITDENIWSDELYRIYGFEPQSFNASYEKFVSLLHPDDQEAVRAAHEDAYRTLEPYSMQERIVRPDGSVRTLATSGEVVADAQGRPIRMRGVCIDITDRLRAEEELARAERAGDRRRQALEINDNVVQGLTTVLWSLERGLGSEAEAVVKSTLESAQAMMSELLDAGESIHPGDLLRTKATGTLLPDSAAPVAGRIVESRQTPRTGWNTVVLADDSDDIRLLLRLQLGDLADVMIVGEASSGPEAVDCATQYQPDILLLDMAMPDGDGLTAIPEILAVSPDTRIIALSGFRASELEEPALEAGAVAYAEKGNFDRLLEVFRMFAPEIRSVAL